MIGDFQNHTRPAFRTLEFVLLSVWEYKQWPWISQNRYNKKTCSGWVIMGLGICVMCCILDGVVYDSGLPNHTCSELCSFDIMLRISETHLIQPVTVHFKHRT